MTTSAPRRPSFKQGDIVFTTMTDRNGIQKDRTAAILTRSREIVELHPIVVIAISRRRESDDDVELPWQRAAIRRRVYMNPASRLSRGCRRFTSTIFAIDVERFRLVGSSKFWKE